MEVTEKGVLYPSKLGRNRSRHTRGILQKHEAKSIFINLFNLSGEFNKLDHSIIFT